jgi:hypothetical protein
MTPAPDVPNTPSFNKRRATRIATTSTSTRKPLVSAPYGSA